MTTRMQALERGKQYHRAGKLAQAEQAYREALAKSSPAPELVWLLGSACQAQGKLDEAVELFRRVVEQRPGYWEAHQNLGVALAERGKTDEACAALERAYRADPSRPESPTDLGDLHRRAGRLDEAVRWYERALVARETPDQRSVLGLALAAQGRAPEAAAQFREAVRRQPGHQVAHSNLLFTLSHDPSLHPAALLTEHLWWDRLHGRGTAQSAAPPRDPDPGRRLRVGYVSGDFRRHAVVRFIEPVLAAHDPGRVEVFAYAELRAEDAVSRRVRGRVAAWRNTCGSADADVARQVRADGVDILVDLAGHTGNNRLGVFAYRPAPVQVTYLGYAGSAGLAAMDYRLTDAAADPPGEPTAGTEELVRLPGCFCCYEPPAEAPEVGPPPRAGGGPVTFGSTHKLVKLNDAVLALWALVLRAVPGSRLLVARNTLGGETSERLRRRLLDHGIGADRLELRQAVDRGDGYLGVYGSVDVLLDVFPRCGHAVACEALWMGVPVVSLRGDRYAGRMGASVLEALGLGELVAPGQEEYVAIAARLAPDPPALAALRAGLRERVRASRLCAAGPFTRCLEEAYRWMWRRCCAAQRPARPGPG
jgi:predicted O-linked N-acetylglucosamine transferase (SPINDLY family)